MTNLAALPIELILQIFSDTSYVTIKNLQCTCRLFRYVIEKYADAIPAARHFRENHVLQQLKPNNFLRSIVDPDLPEYLFEVHPYILAIFLNASRRRNRPDDIRDAGYISPSTGVFYPVLQNPIAGEYALRPITQFTRELPELLCIMDAEATRKIQRMNVARFVEAMVKTRWLYMWLSYEDDRAEANAWQLGRTGFYDRAMRDDERFFHIDITFIGRVALYGVVARLLRTVKRRDCLPVKKEEGHWLPVKKEESHSLQVKKEESHW